MAKRVDMYVGVVAQDGRPEHETLICLNRALNHCATLGLTVIHSVTPPSTSTTKARAMVIEKAIKFKARHLIMVDGNSLFTDEAFTILTGSGADMVAATLVETEAPHHIRAGRVANGVISPLDVEGSEMNEDVIVDYVGFGLVAIHQRVLGVLSRPYCAVEYTDDGVEVGEEVTLCSRIRELGFVIRLNLGLRMGSVGKKIYTIHDYARARSRATVEQVERAEAEHRIITPNKGLVVPN